MTPANSKTSSGQSSSVPTFVLLGRLQSLNVAFKAGRSRFWASRQRQAQKRSIAEWIMAAGVPVFTTPVDVRVRWLEKDRRRDYDNITASVKGILDALVETGRIRGDSQKWVSPVQHEHGVDKLNPRIEVWITEHQERDLMESVVERARAYGGL